MTDNRTFSNRTSEPNQIIWTEDSITTTVRIICVLFLRIGFILVQVGSIPVENVFMIVFRNIVELSTVIFAYGFIGFYLSFGRKSFYGVISYDGYIGDRNADLSSAALGFSACLMGTAITSSMLVARLHQFPMLVLTFLTSSIFLPNLMCWCWNNHGWMTKVSMLEENVAIKDFGGNLVVHVPTAIIGLIGALLLGPRIMKVKDLDRFSLGNEFVTGIVMGYLFIIVGHVGFILPTAAYESTHTLKNCIGRVTINGLMSMGAGILIVSLALVVSTRDFYHYWIIVKCLQGGLAGTVTVAAGIDLYTPPINFAIACGGGAIFLVFSNIVQYTALEDCCNIVAIYLLCSGIGALMPPLLGSNENSRPFHSYRQQAVHLLWQFICLIIIILITTIVYLFIFSILYATGILKNQYERTNHQRSRILHKRFPWKGCFKRNKEISPESNRTKMSETFTAV